jgi:hypothetical protein
MRISVNPEAQPLGDFGYVDNGEYTLRVVSCEMKRKPGGEFDYLQWLFEFADPNVKCVNNEAGKPPKKAGGVFEITTLKPTAQAGLRTCCEALGLKWGDFDTDEVKGIEFRAKVKISEYNGKFKNEVDKFLK